MASEVNPNPRGWCSPGGNVFLDLDHIVAAWVSGSDKLVVLFDLYPVDPSDALGTTLGTISEASFKSLTDALLIYRSAR